MNIKNNNIAAIILSGGQGSRFANVDKGLQEYKGKALVAWVIEALKPQVEKIIVSINRNQDQYNVFQLTTVLDADAGEFNGPIAGILSCAEQLQNDSFDYLLIASCDSPDLTDDYVVRLQDSLTKSDAQVAVVNDGVRNQHLHCLIKTTALANLESYYNSAGRSIYGWLQQLKFVQVDFSNQAESFININTRDELVELEKM